MSVSLNPGWVLAVFLMACRLAGVFFLSEVMGFSTVPAQARVVFVLMIATILASSAGVSIPAGGLSEIGLSILSAAAFIQGALIGAGIRAAIAAFGFGGQLVDFQIGFSAAAILNPATQVQSSLISTLLEMLGALLFLLLNLHQTLLLGLAESFRGMSVSMPVASSLEDAVIQQFSLIFAYGLALVMPVVVGLFMIDLTIAVISRSMPQINIYFVALPFKAFAGLALLAMSVLYILPLSSRVLAAGLSGLF